MTTNLERRLFWQQEAQKMANAFWFWAVLAVVFIWIHLGLTAIFGVIAAVCVHQSFKATERAEGYRE